MSGQMNSECEYVENFFCKGPHHHQAHDLRFLNFPEFCFAKMMMMMIRWEEMKV